MHPHKYTVVSISPNRLSMEYTKHMDMCLLIVFLKYRVTIADNNNSETLK